MVKDHSDSEKGNPPPPHRLLFPINSKGSFICTIPHFKKIKKLDYSKHIILINFLIYFLKKLNWILHYSVNKRSLLICIWEGYNGDSVFSVILH